jgi:hypothetical protein
MHALHSAVALSTALSNALSNACMATNSYLQVVQQQTFLFTHPLQATADTVDNIPTVCVTYQQCLLGAAHSRTW